MGEWREQKIHMLPGLTGNCRVHLAGARWLRRVFPVIYVPLAITAYSRFLAEDTPLNSIIEDVSRNATLVCFWAGVVWFNLIIRIVRPGDSTAPRSVDLMYFIYMTWSFYGYVFFLLAAGVDR
jgi:hypothetical protein